MAHEYGMAAGQVCRTLQVARILGGKASIGFVDHSRLRDDSC
jgi:hypothetical protein